jgi:hypothetical protein
MLERRKLALLQKQLALKLLAHILALLQKQLALKLLAHILERYK